MNENIAIKGDRDGLLLVVNSDRDFVEILAILKDKLDASADFFLKSPEPLSIVYSGERQLTDSEEKQIIELFESYAIEYIPNKDQAKIKRLAKNVFPGLPANSPVGSIEQPAMIIYRTVRGGQEVAYAGNIIIFGDVNPSARVVAKNDIFVVGSTRGILHAGCMGNRNAQIVAGSFNGGQVRIADLIVRAPDDNTKIIGSFEIAKVLSEQIMIDKIHV